MYPKDFIPLFEHNMIIIRLDEYIWEETCRIVRDWINKGYAAVPISVNVSRFDIYSLGVSNTFTLLTEKYGIENHFIEIEITESAFTNDENQILQVVDNLRSSGFRVLMDDFGSGYSSLNILKDINVDVLKIDTRFLEPGRNEKNKGREIFESVIRMAKWIHNGIVYKNSIKEFERMCRHLNSSDTPVSCEMDLLRTGNIFKRCSVTAKTIYGENKPVNQ